MKIVTNPGSNLPPQALAHYGIALSPQQIVVGREAHDTRTAIPYATIDRWIRTSPEFPHVVGTTAPEFVGMLGPLAKEDPELCLVLSSKQIIQTHAAAVSATKTLATAAAFKHVQAAVIDSRATDLGCGLMTIAAGEARRANLGLARAQRMLEALPERTTMAFVPETLENLVKGGRASWARAQIANLLQLRPLIGFQKGELVALDRFKRSLDPGDVLVEHALRTHGPQRPVWAGVIHSDRSDERALRLLARVRATFDVRYALIRPISPSIYLHAGAGSIGLVVMALDGLPWSPPPPSFAAD